MASLYESIASALGQYQPGEGEEISLKVKPAGLNLGGGSGASQPMASASTTGAASGAASGAGTAVAPGGAQQPPVLQSSVPQGQRLPRNAQLPEAPTGVFRDDIFEAQYAQAKHDFDRGYLDVLEQLGWTDASGNFVPGLLEQEAARQRAQLMYEQGLARDRVTGEARRGGTVFSGPRIRNQAQAEHPFTTALSQLETELPLQLGKLYQAAGELRSEFGIQLQMLIAEAAQRSASAAREAPVPPAETSPTENPVAMQAPLPAWMSLPSGTSEEKLRQGRMRNLDEGINYAGL